MLRRAVLLLALPLLACAEEAEAPSAFEPGREELRAGLANALRAADTVAAAFDAAGSDAVARQGLSASLPTTVNPWGAGDGEESVVENPLYEASGNSTTSPLYGARALLEDSTTDLAAMVALESSKDVEAALEHVAGWHAIVAALPTATQDAAVLDDPAVRFAWQDFATALGELRCVMANHGGDATAGEVRELCQVGSAMLSAADALSAIEAVATTLSAELGERATQAAALEAALVSLRDAVSSVEGPGAALDAAEAALVAGDSFTTTFADADLTALQTLLANELTLFKDGLRTQVRPALRTGTERHTAAHEAAHIVQQRTSFAVLLGNSGGHEACSSEGLTCLVSVVAAKPWTGGAALTSVDAAVTAALLAAPDKGVIVEAKAAVRAALRATFATHLSTTDALLRSSRTFHTISNVLKTRHDTVKNAIGNIRA